MVAELPEPPETPELPELPEPPELVATVPTEEIVPAVVLWSGSVTVTLSPTPTSLCWSARRATVTTRRVEVAVRTGPAAGPPRLAFTWLTRSAVGSNTAEPSVSDPDGSVIPRAVCSCCTPYLVSQEK